ncbi:hypothetical protein [Haloarcula sp. H-GB5]
MGQNAMEQWVSEQDDMVIEEDGSITNTETGANTQNNSNSDLDLIEGDGIGGDNSLDSNEEAAEQFGEEVATGEIDGHAPDSEVNAVYGTDGDPVAVAATEDEIEQSEAVMYTTTEQDGNAQMPQNPEEAAQQMRASYQQLRRRLQGQQTTNSGPSPALAVGGLTMLGIAGYWVLYA